MSDMTKCPNCGNMVPAQSRICPVCGTELLALDPMNQGQNPFGYQTPPEQNPYAQPQPQQTPPPGQNPYGQQAPPPETNPYGQQAPPPGQNPYGQQTPPPGQNPYGQQAPPPGQNPYGQPTPPPGASPYGYGAPPPYGQAIYVQNPVNESLRLAAFILCLIGTIIMAIPTFGIALAWGIPMSVHAYRIIHSPYKHIGFSVCCLLFLGVIAGILLLCSGGQEKPTYR
ncbi:hypothetical protein AGMMS49983_11800 [Clostridia bacterium]|nr:hypothetical protein AGMMS49983_11800 [Clostridia bacterium]